MPVSGMKVKQAINEARRWWNKSGRDYFREARERERDGIKDDKELMQSSGILSGKMFDECDKQTKWEIVKKWHRAFCALELGISTDEEFERAGMMEEFAKIKVVGNNGHSLDS